MISIVGAIAASSLGLACPPPTVDAPDGFVTVEDKEEGFSFYLPQNYKEIPREPGDTVAIALFRRTIPAKKAQKGNAIEPAKISEIWILSIDKPVAAAKATDSAESDEAPPSEATPDKGSSAKSEEEALAEVMSADSFEEFAKKRLKDWKIVSHGEKGEKGAKRTEYLLQYPRTAIAQTKATAWVFDRGDRWLGLMGVAEARDFDGQRRNFERSALSLKEVEVSEAATKEIEKYYSLRPEYKDSPFRLARRKELSRGWKAIDTPNFLIIHHTKDDVLLSRVQNDLEAMRLVYEQSFPPVKPVQAVSVVRVCKDRREYLQYGGHPTSAGYWNAAQRELVIYDNVKGQQGSRFGNRDTCITLYHEAFHQFVHYSVGELPPHSWFNEGYGDYFSGARVYANSTKLQEIGPTPWRVDAIKQIVEKRRFVPLDVLVRMEQRDFYENAQVCYPQAWSLVYFLNKVSSSQASPKWKGILPRYFETLKSTYAEELATLGPSATFEQKKPAGLKARKKAVEAAFEGVAFDELQAAWESFVRKLR